MPSTASYVGQDSTTRGAWKGNYGADGYWIAAYSPLFSLPGYVSSFVFTTYDAAYEWENPSVATGALQKPDPSTERIAATYYKSSGGREVIDLTISGTHRVGIYFLDFDLSSRAQTVRIYDELDSHTLLDGPRAVGTFENGVYAFWDLNGQFKIEIDITFGPNIVTSALFFDTPGAGGGGGGGTIVLPSAAMAGGFRRLGGGL